MKYLIAGLCLVLFAHQAVAEQVPTGNHLVRLVCQKYHHQSLDENAPLMPSGWALILEQLSLKTLNTKTALADTIDATELMNPEHPIPYTDKAAFRLRVYDEKLVYGKIVSGKESFKARLSQLTGSQAVRDLLARNAYLDANKRRMDYRGRGFRSGQYLIFRHEGFYLKEVVIDLEDFTGWMETNLGGSNPLQDGLYICGGPGLVPEMVDEENG